MWTWSNFLHAQVPDSLAPLRVNFDETAIRYFQDSRKGFLTVEAQREKRSARSLTQQVSRSDTRAMMSLATFICDDPEVQPLLPQVLLVNKRLLTEAETAAAAPVLPQGVHLWRGISAWTTSAIMVRLLTLLHRCLGAVLSTRKVILSADAFRAHMTQPVFRAAARLGFFYFLVPARMTWVLQPCDTHVFALFKRSLEERVQAATARTADGRLGRPALIECVGATVEDILRRRSWKRAFEDCGLVGTQATVSARTVAKLGTVSLPPAERGLPSLAMLQEVFPKGAWIPIDAVFQALRRAEGTPTQPVRARRHAEARRSPTPVHPDRPWYGRLRSSAALSQGEDTAAAGDTPCPPTTPAVEPETPQASLGSARPERRRPAVAMGYRLALPRAPRAAPEGLQPPPEHTAGTSSRASSA